MTTPPESITALLAAADGDDPTMDDLTVDTETPSSKADDLSDILEPVADDNKQRIGMGIITIFPPSTHPSWLDPNTYFDDPSNELEKWCGKFETTKDGQVHAHIFFKFLRQPDRRPRFNTLRLLISDKIGKGCNIRRSTSHSQKSIQCAINYVLKPETAIADCPPYIWKNSCAFSQKVWDERTKTKDSQKAKVIEYLNSKPAHWPYAKVLHENEESQLLLADCGWARKFHEDRSQSVTRRTIQNVIIMYGAAGTGKTTLARNWDARDDEEYEIRYYRRNNADGDFWGGGRTAYRGQRIIHFDEFTGTEKFGNLKEWTSLNDYGPNVNVKNGGRELNHETVIFTSNVHPAGWYHGLWSRDEKQFPAFHRRITKVFFFPERRPDGTVNEPDADNEPYYIDQTESWVGMNRSYQACLDHAESCWPLKLESVDNGGAFAEHFHLPESRKRDNPFHEYCRTGKYPKNM